MFKISGNCGFTFVSGKKKEKSNKENQEDRNVNNN